MRIYDLIQLARQYMLLGVIVVILLLTGYFLLYKKLMKGTDKLNKFKFGLWSIFVIYIVVVLGATIGHRASAYGNINLHLFSSYKNAYNSFSIREWRNIILNILMFVPLGFMIPLLFKKCKRWYITYLIGFGATLFIEILQLISKRGIFELDDIINNTLGCIIGYGIVIFFISIYEKRYKVLTNIIYQIPLIITVISFSIIFITYSKKELGNLSITNSYNIDMSTIDVSSNVDFNDKSNKAYVYKAAVGDKEEAIKIASEIFSKVNTKIDESQNDEYDDTIVFKSQDGNYSLWVNYTGNTTWFIYHKEFKGKENLSYKDVQALLSKFDIDLPKEASFEDYYGRQRINEIKNSSNVVVAGKEFIPEIGDIHALVNEYYKKPEVLYKKLAKVFEMDKNKLKKLEEENKKLKKEKDDLQKALKSFEREFGSIFCNSRLADNSLVDVISMNKSKDSVVYDSLKNMFNDDKIDELRKTNNLNNLEPNNVVSLKGEQRKKKRSDLF